MTSVLDRTWSVCLSCHKRSDDCEITVITDTLWHQVAEQRCGECRETIRKVRGHLQRAA